MSSLTATRHNAIVKPSSSFQVGSNIEKQATTKSVETSLLPVSNKNPWKSEELKQLGWTKFMRKKSEEALIPLNGIKTSCIPQHRSLVRTASAPVNIPKPSSKGSFRRLNKKQVVRVRSTGVPGLSPGGTRRITYDRDFLLDCRQSPLSLTPPSDLPIIPGATVPRQSRSRRLLEKTDSSLSAASINSFSSATSATTTDEEAVH